MKRVGQKTLISRYIAVTLVCDVLAASHAVAQPRESISFRSPATRVHLLELYSSQGCSSCPPAQQWVSRLKEDQGLWSRFIPVVFHVDYWDRLGWKDRYADGQHTVRQRRYARHWQSRRIYTPMFVLDGTEWRSRRRSQLQTEQNGAGLLVATHQGEGRFDVRFRPVKNGPDSVVIAGVLLGFNVQTDVGAGENAGRVLEHDFIVLQMNDVSAERRGGVYSSTIALEIGKFNDIGELGVAFWVSDAERTEPMQATGGLIEKEK
jgi:hypothetical protein